MPWIPLTKGECIKSDGSSPFCFVEMICDICPECHWYSQSTEDFFPPIFPWKQNRLKVTGHSHTSVLFTFQVSSWTWKGNGMQANRARALSVLSSYSLRVLRGGGPVGMGLLHILCCVCTGQMRKHSFHLHLICWGLSLGSHTIQHLICFLWDAEPSQKSWRLVAVSRPSQTFPDYCTFKIKHRQGWSVPFQALFLCSIHVHPFLDLSTFCPLCLGCACVSLSETLARPQHALCSHPHPKM